MSIPTHPRQPIIYDMMLLAHALVRLRAFEQAHVGIRHPDYCERQTVFENACTKIRGLAQFISATGSNEYIKITDSEFGGIADQRFMAGYFGSISIYVSHLHEQRYIKDDRHPRPKADDVLRGGKEILDHLKPLMDSLKPQLVGDAKYWYGVYEQLHNQL